MKMRLQERKRDLKGSGISGVMHENEITIKKTRSDSEFGGIMK